MKIKVDLKKVLEYISVLFVIYITDSLVFFTNNNTFIPVLGKYVLVIVTFLLVLLVLVKKRKLRIDSTLVFLIVLIFSILATSIFNNDFSRKLFSKIIVLLFGYLFSKIIDWDRFTHIYVQELFLISIVSLIMYFFTDFFKSISFIPIISNVNGIKFFSLGFSNMYYNWRGSLLRNPGPFWEPGAFQAYIILALIFVISNEISIKRKILFCFVFLVTLTSTFSTTAFIAALPLFLAVFFVGRKDINIWLKWLIIIIFTIILFYVYNNEEMYHLVFDKLYNDQNISYVSRYNSLFGGVEVFLNNPIIGVGPVKLESLLSGYSIVNTVVMHYALYGIIVGSFYSINLYKFAKSCISENIIYGILVFASLIISLSGENFVYSLMFNIIIFLRKKENTYGI